MSKPTYLSTTSLVLRFNASTRDCLLYYGVRSGAYPVTKEIKASTSAISCATKRTVCESYSPSAMCRQPAPTPTAPHN